MYRRQFIFDEDIYTGLLAKSLFDLMIIAAARW